MWRLVVVVAAAAARWNLVTNDGTTLNDDDEVVTVPSVPARVPQPQVLVMAELHPQLAAAPQGVQFIPAPPVLPQGQQVFQFVVSRRQQQQQQQQQILLPSLQLPASCGPFIVSLEHETFRGRAYHFSWCHRTDQGYTHQEATAYCRSLARQQPLQFEALSLDDQEEVDFISDVLQFHQISSVWTKETSSSLPYDLRQYIGRSDDSQGPGQDCLSVEGALLTHPRRYWVRERQCEDLKAVICEADPL